MWCAASSTRPRCSACRGRAHHLRGGPHELLAAGSGVGPAALRPSARPRRWPAPRSSSSACPTPQQDDGSADVSALEAAAVEIGPHLAFGACGRQQVDGAGRVGRGRRTADRAAATCRWSPTRSSCARGPPSTTRSTPTGSSSGPRTRRRRPRWARCSPRPARRSSSPTPPTAETIKYACNAFLATKLSFINAVANLCETVGADVRDVLLGHGLRPPDRVRLPAARSRLGRLAASPRTPGRSSTSPSRPATTSPCCAAPSRPTTQQLDSVVDKVRAGAGARCRAASWRSRGLAFKAGTDDLRELAGASTSPAACSPRVPRSRPTTRRCPGRGPGCPTASQAHPDPYAACAGADVLVVLTEWDEFRWVDLGKVRDAMATPYDRRRPEPPRPRRVAPARVHLRRDRAAGERPASRRHRRRGVPRLAPLRRAPRPGRPGRRASTTCRPVRAENVAQLPATTAVRARGGRRERGARR